MTEFVRPRLGGFLGLFLAALLFTALLPGAAQGRYYDVGPDQRVWIGGEHYGAAVAAPLAGFVGSLPHGPEIAKLSVYLAGPQELVNLCEAEEIEGCYSPDGNEGWIILPGEAFAGSSLEEILAHEYGHHLAASRPGWAFGTPRWDVYGGVCTQIQQGQLFPGALGERYWLNPEEIFAESYAALSFPELVTDWRYSPLLRPTPGALEQIALDIERPWPKRYAERRLRRSCGSGQNFYPNVFR